LTDALINPRTRRATGIVIGIAGEWGSGKSSILNLVHEKIRNEYQEAVVLRFDPWLISGRNDLITLFITELIRAIQGEPNAAKKLGNAVNILVKYGEHLAPLGGFWIPLLGPAVRALTGAYREAKKGKDSLNSLRKDLTKELDKVSVPIVVLIDEVDRVEDAEIRSVAQLVRSIADFPGISYALAYDPKRVIQALGSDAPEGFRDERGRAYLEKIVQLQIPLPVTFIEEFTRLLTAELAQLQKEVGLPENFNNIERYQDLVRLLAEQNLSTLRDIARLVGTFHVLAAMLGGEVDWIDLLAYSALLVKAPLTVDAVRRSPGDFCVEVLSEASYMRRLAAEKVPKAERLKTLIPASEDSEGVRAIVTFLFPALSEHGSRRRDDRPQALRHRRPLLTTLRLGLLLGTTPRSALEGLVRKPLAGIVETLRTAYQDETLGDLVDRLDDLYLELPIENHPAFWRAVGKFLEKPDCEWLTSYSPMHQLVRNFAEVLERAVLRDESFRATAAKVFAELQQGNEKELTAHWLRRQIIAYGLFGKQEQPSYAKFLSSTEVESVARAMSEKWRAQHVAGKLISCRWDLMPLYTMIDIGLWDEECRKLLVDALAEDRVVDGLTLIMYGGGYTTERETVEKICSYDKYIRRVGERLKAPSLHESVQVALQKASEPPI
jgi:hypothetical protein